MMITSSLITLDLLSHIILIRKVEDIGKPAPQPKWPCLFTDSVNHKMLALQTIWLLRI